MAETTAPSRSSNNLNVAQLGSSLVLIAVTAALLYYGFIFFRDNSIQQDLTQKTLIVFAAIAWGVGGIALFFYSVNYFIESLPLRVRVAVQPYLFVMPASLLLIYFLAWPALRTLRLSLYQGGKPENLWVEGDGIVGNLSQMLSRFQVNFVGLENYQAFIEPGNVMMQAFRNNLLWIAFGATFSIVFGLLIAVLADRSSFEKVAKSLIFMPMAISFVGAAVIWRFIYEVRGESQEQIGLLNALVNWMGFKPQAWTTKIWILENEFIQNLYVNYPILDGSLDWLNNLFLIVIVIWLQTGFAMVLFSAALKGIPSELLEAARIDGASEGQIFFRIMIPYIRGTILTVSTTVIIFTLKIFDVVWAMTGGNHDTEVIGTQFFRQNFILRNQGFGSAIAMVLLIAVIPVMIYNLRQFSQNRAF